ncbi:MAG TPA: RNA polymerase sigma factor [Phycisphaerae bacterium]|nr:RNA polymerase sigma factor [Phycisphaerae bacterium]
MSIAISTHPLLAFFAAVADSSPAPAAGSVSGATPADADLARSRRGDPEAYARLVRAHQPEVARRMVRFSRDPLVIEELVQEVFVEAWFALPRYRAEAPFEHWLHRIAVRVGYQFWKRRDRERRRAAALEAHAQESSASAPLADDSGPEAVALLEKLPPRDRLALTLLYVEGRSVKEAARLAGWSPIMLKVQAHRARAKLRRLLPPDVRPSHKEPSP